MEQKKTLWIIAGVSFFLLVVFGVAFIAFKPSANYSPTFAKKPAIEKKIQPENGWSNPPAPDYDMNNQRSDLSSAKVNDMVVLSENTTVYDITKPNQNVASDSQPASQSTTIDLNALKRELTAELAAQSQTTQGQNPQNINITVTMPERKPEQSVVITSDYYTGKAKEEAPATKASESKAVTQAPAKKQETPAKTTQTVQKTAKTESKPASAKTTAAPAPAPKTVTRFWVQVAAYTNKKTAENAREILSENKITSDIFTYQDNKNRLFYRVRVGPYTTKSEAEYWQAKISKISDFSKEQSFVTSTND